jgi:type II secretory pathway component PulJ
LEQGVSLVELLIGLAVGSLIVAGALTVFAKISFSGLENVRMVRLNEQLRSTLDLIRRDLQRAGYVDAWQAGSVDIDDLDATAMGVFGAIVINGAGDCITYSYDYDEDADQDANELFGFRLSGTEIQRTTTSTDCDVDWPPITDSEVVIDTLSFELVQPFSEVMGDVDGAGVAIGNEDGFCDAGEALILNACIPNPAEVGNGDGDGTCESGETCLARRKINVVLEGSLAADPAFTISLREEIKVKNDHFFVEP